MSNEAQFMIYCLERYRYSKQLSGKEVIALFKNYSIMDFLIEQFPILHLSGDKHIINEIDAYIREQQVTA
jgi:hypothetical protein